MNSVGDDLHIDLVVEIACLHCARITEGIAPDDGRHGAVEMGHQGIARLCSRFALCRSGSGVTYRGKDSPSSAFPSQFQSSFQFRGSADAYDVRGTVEEFPDVFLRRNL